MRVRPNFIINKSRQIFTDRETQILNKGLKYKPTPRTAPINDIVCAIESSIEFLPQQQKYSTRSAVEKVLLKPKIEAGNANEWRTIESLKSKDVVYLNPDKGKGVVIIEKQDYKNTTGLHL